MSFRTNNGWVIQPLIVGRESNDSSTTKSILNNVTFHIVVTSSIVLLTSTFLLLRTKFPLLTLPLFANNKNDDENKQPSKDTKTATTKKTRSKMVCPFSSESNFIVTMDLDVPPTPLDLYEDWVDPTAPDFGNKPLAARWLNAGLSGQDTPGMLRAGLKRLRDSKYFLVQGPFRIRDELLMKAKALDNPLRKPKVLVFEEDSIAAQQECLELFLDYLPKRYPDLYKYNKENDTLYVVPIDETFYVTEWRASRALELCERIVQEDLILMRPPRVTDTVDNPKQQFVMAAAAVVFSFNELQEKLGRPMLFIHAPVPGYEKYLLKTIDLTFAKVLKTEHPMWRNNWGIDPSGQLDEPLYGSVEAHENRTFATPTIEQIKNKFLKVEYQTIRRLPSSQYILFTVKTMVDPLPSLESVPRAAACLAASIRGMSPIMRKYKGIADDATCDVVLKYLDSISQDDNNAGEVSGSGAGATEAVV